MPDDPRIDALLDRYQDLMDAGRTADLTDICRDFPELRGDLEKRVHRIRKVGELLGDRPLPETAHIEVDAELSLSDDKTWVSHGGGYVAPVEIPAPPGYQVLAPLGEGGMGVVYKARQIGLDRLVALKMILAGSRARAVDLERFRNEAQAIAALRHPNIVQVFEIGDFREQPFFSIEFCAGGSLAKALNGEPQSATAAAGMTEVLARAIHYAHSRGIVHRDLKPGNVLLSAEPAAPSRAPSTIQADAASSAVAQAALRPPYAALKITDFGLAKRVDDDSARTQDGSVMGTPAYMAPEQAFGATKDISSATDIHALGAILYELLTGRPPFKGSTVHDTLEQVRHRDPVAVRTLQPQVPTDLETICLRCLQKDPKKRYPSALALAEDLRRFLDHRPIQARPVGQLTRAWRWVKREPRTATLVGAMALLCIAVPALLVAYSMRLSAAENLIEQQSELRKTAERERKAAREAGETSRYLAAVSEAGRLRTERRPGWTWAAREEVEAAAATAAPLRSVVDLRTELAAAVAAIDLRPVGLAAKGADPGSIAFASDGRLAIVPQFVRSTPFDYRQVFLYDPRTGTEQRLPFSILLSKLELGPDMVTALAFSPDGRWLFMGMRTGSVLRWDLNPNAKPTYVQFRRPHTGAVAGFAFSPDSRWVFTGGHDGRVRRWPTGGDWKEHLSWPETKDHASKIRALEYWNGERAGVLVLTDDHARLLDLESMTEIGAGKVDGFSWVAPNLPGGYGRLAVYPRNGTIVVSKGRELDVYYWERGVLGKVATLIDPSLEGRFAHSHTIEEISFHPSGMLVATVSPDEGVAKVWHLGTGELAVAVPAANSRAIAFSPDGSRLAVAGDHVTTVYEIGGLKAHTFLGRRGFPMRAMCITHDGLIATVAGQSNGGGAVATLWDSSGKAAETVIHSADVPVVTGQYRVASCAASAWTAFHVGDDKITWRGRPGAPPITIEVGAKSKSHFDLCIDRNGQCWIIDGNDLTVRTAASEEMPRSVFTTLPWNGRKGLACVRARGSHVLVGCDNAYLRVLDSNGKMIDSLLCAPDGTAGFHVDSANTVHATALTEDGRQGIAGTEDGRLWLYRLPGERLWYPKAHEKRVTTVAFDQTAEWMASGSRDTEVKLWRRTGNVFDHYLTLKVSSNNPVRQVVFTPTGDRLLVIHEQETAVRVWNLKKLRERFQNLGLDPARFLTGDLAAAGAADK